MKNNEKREAALKNEAGGDEKHLFFSYLALNSYQVFFLTRNLLKTWQPVHLNSWWSSFDSYDRRNQSIGGWKRNNWISLIHYSIQFFLSYSLILIQFCSIFIIPLLQKPYNSLFRMPKP